MDALIETARSKDQDFIQQDDNVSEPSSAEDKPKDKRERLR